MKRIIFLLLALWLPFFSIADSAMSPALLNSAKTKVEGTLQELNKGVALSPGSFEMKRRRTPGKVFSQKPSFIDQIESYAVSFVAYGSASLISGKTRLYCAPPNEDLENFVRENGFTRPKNSRVGQSECWFGQAEIFSKGDVAIAELFDLGTIDDSFVKKPAAGAREFRMVGHSGNTVTLLGGFNGTYDCDDSKQDLTLATSGIFGVVIGKFKFQSNDLCRRFENIAPYLSNSNPVDVTLSLGSGEVTALKAKHGRNLQHVLLVFYAGPEQVAADSGAVTPRWLSWDENFAAVYEGGRLNIYAPGGFASDDTLLGSYVLNDSMIAEFGKRHRLKTAPFVAVLDVLNQKIEKLKFVSQARIDQVISWD